MMILREYQQELIDKITTASAGGKRRILVQLPCGAGKTVCFAKIIAHATANLIQSLVLVHRRELLFQTLDKLKNYGVESGVILVGEPHDPTLYSQVASIQTLYSRSVRRFEIPMPEAKLVIVDECAHLASSKTWQRLVASYPEAYIIGFTATPVHRGVGLGHFFDDLIVGPSVQELIDLGYLVKPRYYVPSIPDLKGIKISQGDYAQGELETRMNIPKLIGDIAENWSRVCRDRKTLIFCSGVKHSIHVRETFRGLGIKADHVDGTTIKTERDEIVKNFTYGDIQVLSSVGVFTEGVDIPAASALILARPTKSLMLYLQVTGRVLRPFDGKQDAIIMDHSGAVYEHGLIEQDREWTLLKEKEKETKTTTQKQKVEKVGITCEVCKYLYTKELVCPMCGWKPEIKGKYVETYEAYLQELSAIDNPPLNKLEWWQGLNGYALEKNYKPGWAFYKYQEKFNTKPPYSWKNIQPLEPNLEIRSWIKYRQIVWAKSKRNPENVKSPIPS